MRTHSNGKQAASHYRFSVRSGVPLPTRSLYPFHRMEVGDSFAIPSGVSENSVRASAKQYVERQDGKVKFRVLRTGRDSFGCWRVK